MFLNMAKNTKEPKIIFEKIKNIAKKNIGEQFKIDLLGQLINSKVVSNCVKQRKLFTKEHPYSNESESINNITEKIVYTLEHKLLKKKNNSFSTFFKKLISSF